jgi:class 3 adenylate cyclase
MSASSDNDKSAFFRWSSSQNSILVPLLVIGFVVGVAYRAQVDEAASRDLANYLRSGFHGFGVALTGWAVQEWFARNAQSSLGAALRRLPLLAELLFRSMVMAFALITAGFLLQFALYAEAIQTHWLTGRWLTETLPFIVAIGFSISLIVGIITGIGRLVGGPMFLSVILGTYHRPARRQLIVMFLDIAGSTRLAEEMGELRVHDLITRFFFDIDEPISNNGGAVHAYVGDEVIVTWPLTDDRARNARCLTCFFAIERKMSGLAVNYKREFKTTPMFRAGLHCGPVIVSECGDAKRQLAFFGDTMNVVARLCEHGKSADLFLVVSGDLLSRMAMPAGLCVRGSEHLALRGREGRIEAATVTKIVATASSDG